VISDFVWDDKRGMRLEQGSAAIPLSVEVWFDLICPWCLIGKRQLELAVAEFARLHPGRPVSVRWRSQQLLPDVPPQGLPFREFYLRRLGSAEAVAARQAQVREAASTVGLALDFSAIAAMPNTRAAHALIADAQAQCDAATVDALIEDLFAAHFMRGVNLDDGEFLGELARNHGVTPSNAPPGFPPMASGVPLFVAERIEALSGAQSPQRLLAMLLRVAQAQAC
jgi:predicted DsbA family dithiol-disulfide isomerase